MVVDKSGVRRSRYILIFVFIFANSFSFVSTYTFWHFSYRKNFTSQHNTIAV